MQSDPVNACAAIILAAGKSTRMRSKTPKALHPICGLPMTSHVIRACKAAGVERIVVVVGHESEAVIAGLGNDVEYALQVTQRGTGDAVSSAAGMLGHWPGTILVLTGDTPLITPDSICAVRSLQAENQAPLGMLTVISDDPTGYGRVVRRAGGAVMMIVEQRDATPEQRAIKEWNPSVYLFQSAALWKSLAAVTPNNDQGEYYLTDTVRIIAETGARIEASPVSDSDEMMGVNTRVELARADAIMRERINRTHMLSGVTIVDPDNTYVDVDVTIGEDTTVHPGTHLFGVTEIGPGCTIGPHAIIRDTVIGSHCSVTTSQLVGCVLAEAVRVGPFANLRPGTRLGNKVRIGDFVEIKNSVLDESAQVSHLTYIGDAEVGAGTNIGAGTVTCNYDGFHKHRTTIGANAFIGSHTTLIAPVRIGNGAIVAAGTTVPSSPDGIADDAMAIGRPEVIVKPQWASKYRERKTKIKD